MSTQTICDRCGLPITKPAEIYRVQDGSGATYHVMDFCKACHRAFEDFIRTGGVKPTLPLLLDQCPHGSQGTACCICLTPICNLCGLYSTGGRDYCHRHKPEFALTAR